ncbi:hypothetical protein [Methylocystis sp. Sn-Cys]|uniref:hypothetical protein n=1 Tax=Methylocystis sp. Sn-Cys TaxID=1701263 RepID=UPI0019230A72|nr:hypothetical protein [Methylocystis sp. Sn-Cys]MBL1256036.1 hypothetical protein [Methylocystis sp. Sn-Cys]
MAKNSSKKKPQQRDTRWEGSRLFEVVAEAMHATESHVERVKLFGFDCLRLKGKVFAKASKGRLVVKLPATRVASLMMAGCVEPYAGARGNMKEWAVVTTDDLTALGLSQEALSFVR